MVFQILHEDWLFNLTEKAQAEVLEHAPQEFLDQHASKLKPQSKLIDWSQI